jgi:hypothetical protein
LTAKAAKGFAKIAKKTIPKLSIIEALIRLSSNTGEEA